MFFRCPQYLSGSTVTYGAQKHSRHFEMEMIIYDHFRYHFFNLFAAVNVLAVKKTRLSRSQILTVLTDVVDLDVAVSV